MVAMTSRAFLAMLVEVDKYDVVEIHFLPVGHTHDEHDAWFGKIAVQVDSFPFLIS